MRLSNPNIPVLQLVAERKLSELLPQDVDLSRLEASGVLARGDYLYLVFDNVSRVARVSKRLSGRANSSWFGALSKQRGFEDIAYNRFERRFFLLIEGERTGSSYESVVLECDENFVEIRRDSLEFAFDSENKGFEGLTWLRRHDGDYLLALCEGNKCKSGKAGRKPGGGRIQRFRKDRDVWRHVDTMKLPESIDFEDYSALDVREERVAVVSQASSKIWIGSCAPASWDFVDEGAMYSFPTDHEGRVVYCNAEGIAWLAAEQVAVVSDRAKKDDQHESCRKKDQMVHIFNFV
jgi:hypothetical protein